MQVCRIPYMYDADSVSKDNAFAGEGESMTKQEFKDECDINTIIDRFGIGENPIEALKWVENVDIVDAAVDYQTAMNQLNEARDQFMTLPAKVRSKFDNSPHLFVNFVSDPANAEEMYSMGLAVKPIVNGPSDTDRIIEALNSKGTGSS